MGFSGSFGAITSAAVTHATNLLGDLAAPVALIFGVAVLALVLGSLRAFLPR
jgi:hypothetical protein